MKKILAILALSTTLMVISCNDKNQSENNTVTTDSTSVTVDTNKVDTNKVSN